jgi:predicted HTH domain antitoxin
MKREGDFMGNVQAVIDLPEQLYLSLSASGLTKEKIASESRKLLALKCFRDRVLSLGRSAELSGLSKWDFIEFLGDNNIPVVDHEEEELAREFETAERLGERLKK